MARLLSLVSLLALVALATGCGGDEQDGPPQQLGPAGLAGALDLARDAGPLALRLEVTTTRPGRGKRPQFSADGRIDISARAGQATLRLPDADELGLPAGLPVSWTADRITVNGRSVPRARGREDWGQLGRLPDELQALAELVADGQDVRERDNGSWTFSVSAPAALRRGIPPQPQAGDTWTGEAQAAADGRLRRVVLRVPTPALGATVPAGVAELELRLG